MHLQVVNSNVWVRNNTHTTAVIILYNLIMFKSFRKLITFHNNSWWNFLRPNQNWFSLLYFAFHPDRIMFLLCYSSDIYYSMYIKFLCVLRGHISVLYAFFCLLRTYYCVMSLYPYALSWTYSLLFIYGSFENVVHNYVIYIHNRCIIT